MDDLQSPLGPGHVPIWMMGLKPGTSTPSGSCLSKTLASAEEALEGPGRPEEAPPRPGCPSSPAGWNLRLDCHLGHVSIPHTSVFHVVGGGDNSCQLLSCFFTVLINFRLQKDDSHSVLHPFQLECFLGGSAGKESMCNAGDLGSVPGLGRSPGEGNGSPLQCSCLENPMDCIYSL